MKCNEVLTLLDPLIDDELPHHEQEKVFTHLTQCPECQTELDEMRVFQLTLQKCSTIPIPDSLLITIKERIEDETKKQKTFWNILAKFFKNKDVFTHTGTALVSAFLVFIIMNQPFQSSTQEIQIFNAHLLSLSSNLVTVKSSDQHTVKPWFAGKIKFSPHVPDISKDGFKLLGGRIDSIANNDLAVLSYQVRKHKINVFIEPLKKTDKQRLWSHNGYNLITWHDVTFSYSAISDISLQELETFSQSMINTTLKL
jgi:anti-sigma factor RsiW